MLNWPLASAVAAEDPSVISPGLSTAAMLMRTRFSAGGGNVPASTTTRPETDSPCCNVSVSPEMFCPSTETSLEAQSGGVRMSSGPGRAAVGPGAGADCPARETSAYWPGVTPPKLKWPSASVWALLNASMKLRPGMFCSVFVRLSVPDFNGWPSGISTIPSTFAVGTS